MNPPDTDAHDEHYESIPWDALVTADAGRRRRIVYLAAAAVVVAGLAAAVTMSMLRGREPVASETPAPTTSVATASETTMPPAPLSESDLSSGIDSVGTSSSADLVAAYAGWFAADFFTADGSDVTADAVTDRLPVGLAGPDGSSGVRSFVESAIPIEIEELGEDRYRVVVVVRYLASADGFEYRRPPAVALQMVVEVTPDGPALVDLPAPVPVPASVAMDAPNVDGVDAPADVLEAARSQASAWGEPSETVVSAGSVGDVWRVQLTVVTADGLELPVAVWVDGDAQPIAAGGR